MLFAFTFLIFIKAESLSYSWATSEASKAAVDATAAAEHALGAAIDSTACTDENKTFTLDIKVHAQDTIVRSIHSIAKSAMDYRVTESEAVEAFFGAIIDELNTYFIKFKVQFHLNLDGYNTDDFMGTNAAFDTSCEKTSPVIERTSAAFSFLKQSFNGNIGLHLFVWGCPHIPPAADLQTIYSNLKCGRIMGVMWKGAEETRALIKGVIVNAVTGISHAFSATDGMYDATVVPKLCKYVNECVGMDKSEIGQVVPGTELVKYTNTV